MSFDLNSSSSDLENPIKLRRVAQDSASDDDSDSVSGRVHQQIIDEELVESIRSALHLAVGNICREQDAAADATDNNSSFITSNGAIAALTDLTFHYSTTLFANDLVSFSSHAGRKMIKPEDVLLMSRKEKSIRKGMKSKMKEIQARNNNKDRGKKKKSVSPTRKKPNSDRSTSPTRQKTAVSKKKPSKKAGKSIPKTQVFSDSSSSGDESAELAKMCQRVTDKDLEKSARKNRDDGSIHDFIVDDEVLGGQEGDGEVDFQLRARKKKPSKTTSTQKKKSGQKTKSNRTALFNSSTAKDDIFKDLDSDSSSEVVGRAKYKTIDAHFSKKSEGKSEDMAIDLGSDSD